MKNPFTIPLDPVAGYSASLNTSRAITSVLGLTPDDTYDVAVFQIGENYPPVAFDQVVIGLEALAPNCPPNSPLSSADFYPSLALLGPSTDPNFPPVNASTLQKLPFPVPEGYGAIIRSQPRAPLNERAVYSAGPFNSYLLPYPVTPDCITNEQTFKDCANGTAAQSSIITDVKLTTPGQYYIVWWDPNFAASTRRDTTSTVPSMEETPSVALLSSVPIPESMQRPGLPRQVTISLGVAEETTARERQLQLELMIGQQVPAFNPCTGTFNAPAAFIGGAGAAMPPGME